MTTEMNFHYKNIRIMTERLLQFYERTGRDMDQLSQLSQESIDSYYVVTVYYQDQLIYAELVDKRKISGDKPGSDIGHMFVPLNGKRVNVEVIVDSCHLFHGMVFPSYLNALSNLIAFSQWQNKYHETSYGIAVTITPNGEGESTVEFIAGFPSYKIVRTDKPVNSFGYSADTDFLILNVNDKHSRRILAKYSKDVITEKGDSLEICQYDVFIFQGFQMNDWIAAKHLESGEVVTLPISFFSNEFYVPECR